MLYNLVDAMVSSIKPCSSSSVILTQKVGSFLTRNAKIRISRFKSPRQISIEPNLFGLEVLKSTNLKDNAFERRFYDSIELIGLILDVLILDGGFYWMDWTFVDIG